MQITPLFLVLLLSYALWRQLCRFSTLAFGLLASRSRLQTLDPEKFNGPQRDLPTIIWTLNLSIFIPLLSTRSCFVLNMWRKNTVAICTGTRTEEYWSFCQRVTSPTTSSPTYEVDSPTSNVSSPTLLCQSLRNPMFKTLFRLARQWMKQRGISCMAHGWKNEE